MRKGSSDIASCIDKGPIRLSGRSKPALARSMPIVIVLACRFGDNRSDTSPETSGRTANVTATSQIQQNNTPAPDANQIRAAVQASQAFASGLLDQLRRD